MFRSLFTWLTVPSVPLYITLTAIWFLETWFLENHVSSKSIFAIFLEKYFSPKNILLDTVPRFFPRPIRLRISRATIHFFFLFFLRHFCLRKAYNLCHQVALVDRPMRREVAIRWTNRKRAASSLGKCHSDWNTQNSPMLPTTIAMSNDVSWTWE